MIKVLFICHGNICRSTMAEFVFKDMIRKEGLQDNFVIDSAATSREEIGNDTHYGTKEVLRKHKIPFTKRQARQMTKDDYEKYDYLIGMDTANIRNINRIIGDDPKRKVYKLMSFAGSSADVADPWYTGEFDVTYQDIIKGCRGILEKYLHNI